MWVALFLIVALISLARLSVTAQAHVVRPPLWDFKVFWTVGRVAASEHDVYDPVSYAPYRASVNPTRDPEFDRIALGIGMPYPPPAIFLFYPLGWFASISAAMTAWYALLFASLAVAIGLFYRAYFAKAGAAGALAASVLVLVLPATAETVGLGQLNFLALCSLLLFWRERSAWRTGLWLAALLVLRPFFIVFVLYLAARRRWNALVATVAALATMFAVSIPLVGWKAVVSYVRANPSERYPQTYFTGFESLYKIVSHVDRRPTAHFSIGGHPIFLALALLLLAASYLVCARAAARQREACLALLVAVGLFIYPNTGAHYAVLLLPPLGLLWRDRAGFGIGTGGAIAAITCEYVVMTFGAATTGLVFALDIALFAVLALRPGAFIVAGPTRSAVG